MSTPDPSHLIAQAIEQGHPERVADPTVLRTVAAIVRPTKPKRVAA